MSSGKLLVEGRRPRTCCGICIQWPAFSWYLVHDIELTLCCFQCPPTKICSQSELFISLLSKWATFHSVPSDTFLFELTLMGKYEKDSICWIINSLKMNPFSCPGRMFSYCVRARAYTHVLARVYSTRASTCTLYTCFTLPHTCVNLTGLQLWVFQRARSFVNEIRTSMLSNKFFTGA